jgi:hypothetical protein
MIGRVQRLVSIPGQFLDSDKRRKAGASARVAAGDFLGRPEGRPLPED